MPSLNALGEFKASFSNIANEKKDVLARNLPFDDFDLPGAEAPPMELPVRESYIPAPVKEDISPAPDDGGFDFSAFLGSLSADVNPPPLDEPPSIDDLFGDTAQPSSLTDDLSGGDFPFAAADETPAGDASLGGDDFSAMEGLLSGFSDEVESSVPDSGDFGSTDFGSADFGSTDFGSADLGSADLGSAGFGGEDSAGDDLGSIDLGGENPLDEFESPDTDLKGADFSDFNLPDTEPLTDNDEFTGGGFGDFSLPADTSSDLSDGIDLGGEEPPSYTMGDDLSPDDAQPADMGIDFDSSLPDTSFPGTDFGSDFDSPLPNADFSSDFDTPLPDADFSSDFDTPLPDTDFSGTDFDTGFDSSLPDTDFSGLGIDTGFDSALPDMDFSGMDEAAQDSSDFDSDGEIGLTSESGFEDTSSADFGSDFDSASIDLDSGIESHDDTFGSDDFSLPGLENILEKSRTDTSLAPAPKRKYFRKRKEKPAEIPEAEEDIEEIQLSQDALNKMLRTLAGYPLNLRVACEEMIAEQVLLPRQLSKLIRLLVNGANVREAAALAEEITGKPIVIPKSFEKMTGVAFEAEQSSFTYIFIHNFLPVLRLFAVVAALAASVIFLGYRFVYIPIKAESLYKRGYERIPAGEYQRSNQLFNEAFATHKRKKWFYRYAEAFRDQRRYLLAEEKYDELLLYYPRDKKGVLDYAGLNTYYLLNYDKANRLLQQQLLDYAPNDFEGLLAAGDNFLLWADSDPSRFYDRYEDARFSYARLLEKRGWQAPIVERMLRYFIRTDNLKETLYLRVWFENDKKRKLSASSLAELGGYLLDKQLGTSNISFQEKPKGVPDPYIESIESVRAMLLQAVSEDPFLPEPHYHLARYHHSLGNTYEERLTLENAVRAFDLAQTETVRRRLFRADTHFRYANLLVDNREFFPAEEQLIKGIQLYEDFLSRNLIRATPQLGQLYSAKGDIEYFVKSGDMRAALNDYRLAERYGYSPPEIQYRMGAAYYQLAEWGNALEYLFKASAQLPLNRRILYALGNAAYQRKDYFAAQGYYNRLLDILENQRIRLPVLLPNDNLQFLELGERLMMTRNNAGVVYEALAEQTGNREYRSRALALYAESARAWDSITRDPQTMIRMRLTDTPGAPGINLGYLNANNAMHSRNNYSPEIFVRIDKDVLEPSRWEELAPFGGLQ